MRIRITSNEQLKNSIREKIKKNNGFCSFFENKTEENKCMCQEFIEQSRPGFCHLGLYEKVEE